jgi:hypothetical protein
MKYSDLRDFLRQLEAIGQLKRIAVEVDPVLEMTEIADRVLRAGGPALLFEKPKGPRHAGAGQPVRHARAGGHGHRHGRRGRRSRRRLEDPPARPSANCWPTSRNPSRPRACATPGTSCRC